MYDLARSQATVIWRCVPNQVLPLDMVYRLARYSQGAIDCMADSLPNVPAVNCGLEKCAHILPAPLLNVAFVFPYPKLNAWICTFRLSEHA